MTPAAAQTASPAYAYRPLLDLLVAQVRASLGRQVLDQARPDDGCFLDPAAGPAPGIS